MRNNIVLFKTLKSPSKRNFGGLFYFMAQIIVEGINYGSIEKITVNVTIDFSNFINPTDRYRTDVVKYIESSITDIIENYVILHQCDRSINNDLFTIEMPTI